MTGLDSRGVVRVTNERDHRSGKPLVIALMPGGRLLRIKVKGARRWYVVTVKQVWYQGALNRAAEIRAEKAARRRARKAAKQ